MRNRFSFGILALVALALLGTVSVAFFTARKNAPSDSATLSVVDSRHAGTSSMQEDPDQDGVPNWKEALWGTDPNNPDSDGDGVSDGEEIERGANPLKEGAEPVAPGSTAYTAPRGLPATEALARELFTSYADAKKDGTFSTQEVNVAFADILARRLQESEPARAYTLADLSFAPEISVSEYERALSATLRKTTAVREYELNVFARAVTDANSLELEKLTASALVYEAVRDELLALAVPEKVAEEHLATINSLSELARSAMSLGAWGGDPFDALALVNTFSDAENGFSDELNSLYALVRAIKEQS